jgi:hypothetical protein
MPILGAKFSLTKVLRDDIGLTDVIGRRGSDLLSPPQGC